MTTHFANGSYLTPSWCNLAWDTSGGHTHYGNGLDGDAQKILLTDASCVTGLLPMANLGFHNHDGTNSSKIILTDASCVTGLLPASNLPATVVYTTMVDPIVKTGTFDVTFPTSKTITINFQRHTSGRVSLYWVDLLGMASSTTHYASGAPVDIDIIPTSQYGRYIPIFCSSVASILTITSTQQVTPGQFLIRSLDGATPTVNLDSAFVDYYMY